MNLTPEQYAAIYTHDQNLIVVAGAGSGKTRVLVERYLALLEANPDWLLNALVAVTFTKKAAGEMRDRVRQSLEERLAAADAAGDESAAERWSELLASMDSARIDTIHGLCASILRANAADAAVDPQFEVMDEVQAALLLDDVLDAVLRELVAEGDPALELVAEYGANVVRDVAGDTMLLRALAESGADEARLSPEALLARWRELWEANISQQIELVFAVVNEHGTCEPADDNLGDLWRDALYTLDALQDANTVEDALNSLGVLAGLKFNGVRASKKADDLWGDRETFTGAKNALMAIRDAAKDALKSIGEPPDTDVFEQRAAELVPLWAHLLERVAAAYNEVKTSQRVLDFDDLELLTSRLLKDSPTAQNRYRGAEFKHLLVDEFQDTNAAQWDIIKGLADLQTPGSLFVVGDEKQSIYAFRGADVSVFGAVRQEIVASGGAALTLSRSFRTHTPLIQGFNVIFGAILKRDESSPAAKYQVELGTPMDAFRESPPAAMDDSPLVEFLAVDAIQRDETGVPIPAKRGWKSHDAETRRRWEAYELGLRVKQMVEGGKRVFDRETGEIRPMRYDDVAFLFRAMTNIGLYEEVFKAIGLPYVTVGGRGYYDRQEVWDVLSLLSAVYNPRDELSLMAALRSPLFGLSDDALLALRLSITDDESTPETLWNALASPGEHLPDDERETLRFARFVLEDLRRRAGRVMVAELLREALAQTGYLAVLTGLPDGARLRRNVEKLLEIALQSGEVELGAFTRYLRDLSDRETREGEAPVDVAGAVTLMSVHASKGLEYPVIAIGDASSSRRGGASDSLLYDPAYGAGCKVFEPETTDSSKQWVQSFVYRQISALDAAREDAESLRLLYVAATRAQDYLLVSGSASESASNGWKANGWFGLLLESLHMTDYLDYAVDTVVSHDWGTARLRVAHELPPDEVLVIRDDAVSGWDEPAVQAGDSLPGDAVQPPLLAQLTLNRADQVRHLAATHIADLGGADKATPEAQRQFYRERFRRQVLHDAPTVIDALTTRKTRVTGRQIGEIVHEALRWWRFPGGEMPDDAYMDMLRGYAWRQGITDEALCDSAARAAFDLLRRFVASHAYQQVETAAEQYRELPFVYTRDGRIVHGIIDTLLRRQDGSWVVMDYKTGYVPGGDSGDTVAFERHAKEHYALQVGVYAEAASAQVNTMPQTLIHYVRYTKTVEVPESVWRPMLDKSLFERIEAVVK